MEFLNHILSNSQTFFLSAFILGLMTAISPCPLATNITAVAFISRKLDNHHKVFQSGLFYTFGRMISYFLLALVLYLGADQLQLSAFFQQHSEKFLGPLLVIVGLVMLNLFSLSFHGLTKSTDYFEKKKKLNFLDAFLIGFLFALAFCPYSGILYFGMLIPMTISHPAGMVLPLIFALAMSIPVVIIAWLLAFMMSSVGKFYNQLQNLGKWFQRLVAVIFIVAGIYYIITINFAG